MLPSDVLAKKYCSLMNREEFQDAKVVKAMQMTGIFKNVLEKTRSKEGEN